ncbi:MAG TPA: cation transporter [Verrucomicrobiae bacterium]|nr:cation transporter [Verrucomicrobiae bacterium]
MKRLITALVIASALVLSACAEESAKLSNVHLCCDKCVKGVDTAVGSVSGVKATCDKEAGTVELTGSDKESVQKAADALVAADHFGTSSDVKLDSATGAKTDKVQTMKISGMHICCAKCVKAIDKAVKSVPGVAGETAAKGVDSFEVTGDFSPKDVMDALQKAGLTGKAN